MAQVQDIEPDSEREQLGASRPEWLETLPAPATTDVIFGKLDGYPRVGLLVKRTYEILPTGTCVPLDEELQEVLFPFEIPYEELEGPNVSPRCQLNDYSFKSQTDLVVQGVAHTYAGPVRSLQVALKHGSFQRQINVFGDRSVSWHSDRPVFGEAQPFETMPITYDRAFGGYDHLALEREPPSDLVAELQERHPGYQLEEVTKFHYPRNPAGTGYQIAWDPSRIDEVRVPNLEYPFDPVTPERMAVGRPDRWHNAPMPAGMDFQPEDYFPRCCGLGVTHLPEGYSGRLAEQELDYLPEKWLETEFVLKSDAPIRSEFLQAASPGMSFESFDRSQLLELTNLHPDYPRFAIQLPQEFPLMKMEIRPGREIDLQPHLNTVVVRPSMYEVVVTWCCNAVLTEFYDPAFIVEREYEIDWIAG